MNRSIRSAGSPILALALALALGACDSPAGPVPVSEVTVEATAATLMVGETAQFTAVARDGSGAPLTGRSITWSSSDQAVATVNGAGLVTASAAGTATIAASAEGRTGSATVTVLGVLAAPEGIAAERRSRLRARVAWAAVADAQGYRVERRRSGGVWEAAGETDATAWVDHSQRDRGEPYEYRVVALADGRTSAPSESATNTVPAVRVALIGDSNLARGKSGSTRVATSYVEGGSLAIDPESFPDHPKLLSGKIMGLRPDVEAVNHGIANTRTGTGTVSDRPNALHAIGGVTRFAAEVLGEGYPWTANAIPRVNAFRPTPADFGYYSLGVNDIHAGVSPMAIRDNIAAAIDLWLGADLAAERLIITTIGPRTASPHRDRIPVVNELIRALATERGVSLVDIAVLVSDDDGLTWKSGHLQTGDGLHYTEATLDLIAAAVVEAMGRVER